MQAEPACLESRNIEDMLRAKVVVVRMVRELTPDKSTITYDVKLP